jgi:phosphatidylglycerophosphatase A
MNPGRSMVAVVLGTWFGCGLVPAAPGTMGTLGAIPLYWLAVREGGQTAVASVAILVTVVGVWAASVVQRGLRVEDPQSVVIDEVAGMLFTMIPVVGFSWRATAAGFAVFRVLDVWKPWPIRRFEALPSGWGIVLDDVAAGILGAGAMLALREVGALP